MRGGEKGRGRGGGRPTVKSSREEFDCDGDKEKKFAGTVMKF